MATLSPDQVYALLIQAGFTPAAATTMTAISGAESGWNDKDLGDTTIETSTWGPSYGLFQIRTQKPDTGSGGNRDVQWLAASDLNQAKAAYAISSGGTDFSPWTTYTSGKYQSFLSQATAAAKSGASLVTNGVGSVASTAAGVVGDWVAPLIDGAKGIFFTAGFAALGVGLLIGGAFLFVRPQVKKVENGAISALGGG